MPLKRNFAKMQMGKIHYARNEKHIKNGHNAFSP